MEIVKAKELDLAIQKWQAQWLRGKVNDVAETLAEIIKMEQTTDISLCASARNNVYIFNCQVVNVNINEVLGGAALRAGAKETEETYDCES